MKTRTHNSLSGWLAFAGASMAALCANLAIAQTPMTAEDLPAELEGVTITEHLNEKVPLELTFTDETGADHRLGEYFSQGKPVILVPGYYRCPMLCDLTRSGLVEAMNELDWSAGEQFI